MRASRDRVQVSFKDTFGSDFGGLLKEVPDWVQRAIGRKLGISKLVLVSAVCPDYEVIGGRFTYERMGDGLPYTAEKHLPIIVHVQEALSRASIKCEYHITLADTEFDLSLAVEHLAGGDPFAFLARCEASCRALAEECTRRGISLASCQRFTAAFPKWFPRYDAALEIMRKESAEDAGRRHELAFGSSARLPLHRAMAGKSVSIEYCREMVLRQWAQYMAWGECATERFGEDLVMMNHDTPNLGLVNHPAFRQGRERIPILKLSISTMPDGAAEAA